MNRIILIGNLVRDPETTSTASGLLVTKFTVAVTRKIKNNKGEKETDFINVVTWRQLAEVCEKWLCKGRKVAVEGELQQKYYEAKDGTKRLQSEVVADNVEFLASTEYAENQKQTKMEELKDEDKLPF